MRPTKRCVLWYRVQKNFWYQALFQLNQCLVQVGNGIELEAAGLQVEPYRWRPCGVAWHSSRIVVVINLNKAAAYPLVPTRMSVGVDLTVAVWSRNKVELLCSTLPPCLDDQSTSPKKYHLVYSDDPTAMWAGWASGFCIPFAFFGRVFCILVVARSESPRSGLTISWGSMQAATPSSPARDTASAGRAVRVNDDHRIIMRPKRCVFWYCIRKKHDKLF